MWNLGGLNPKFKDFSERHPNKTMIGMAWSLYWRFALFFIALEILFGIGLILLAFIINLNLV